MLARVVALLMPLWLDCSAAAGLDATLELRIVVMGRRMPFRLRVVDDSCRVSPGSAPEAGAQITIGLIDAVKLGLGLSPWPGLLASGRLELSGDPFLALRFPTMFRPPAIGSAVRGQA